MSWIDSTTGGSLSAMAESLHQQNNNTANISQRKQEMVRGTNTICATTRALSIFLIVQLCTLSHTTAYVSTNLSTSNHITIKSRKQQQRYNTFLSAKHDDSEDNHNDNNDYNRRNVIKSMYLSFGTTLLTSTPKAALAANAKSRTEGYAVQKSEREWAYILSGAQYNILRQGGTERPNSSILESEEREGTYVCAGCNTPLFDSKEKFHSGTGWPSFASALPDVEVEKVNPVQANLAGAELRCGVCGGHLGDVFQDGFLFVNTPAFVSGKRYCIDGAALVFKPVSGEADVIGDTPPPRSEKELPGFLQPPKINARS